MIVANKIAKQYANPERLAEDYLKSYFKDASPSYPINPFKMLKDEGILFVLKNFNKLEGMYIPACGIEDEAVVGINFKRPITRQRFTAAHELCHHLRDADKQIACPIGDNNKDEIFANNFAAAILMPLAELKRQTKMRAHPTTGYVSFDAVLEIADYFGVSFNSCLFRIAYKIHAIEGDIEASALRKRASKYKPELKRQERGMHSLNLYEDLIDAYAEVLAFTPTKHAKLVFEAEYIYNDSRMEGVQTTAEEAAEIIADLRLNQQNSAYCKEENEAYLSVAGHYAMYQGIFNLPVDSPSPLFKDLLSLNRSLFSYYPDPSYGGSIRQTDTLVMGAKFETLPPQEIPMALVSVEQEVKKLFNNKSQMALSKYIEAIIKLHHRLTVIHPFGDGNGRTLRAYMNVLLVRGGICPMYIKTEDKDGYLRALEIADKTGDFTPLYECIMGCILKTSIDLIRL